MLPQTKKQLLTVGFLLTLLYALHGAIPIYLLSTFLSGYLNTAYVSVLYVIAYALTFLVSINLSKILHRYHNYRATIFIICIDFLAMMGLAFIDSIWLTALFFIIFIICSALLLTTINIFIEQYKNKAANEYTGSERGIFLTLLNLGFLMAPLLTSRFIEDNNFTLAFLISGFCLIPMLILMKHYFAEAPEPHYKSISFRDTFNKIRRDKNILGVMIAQFVSEAFIAIMVIYVPLYLEGTLNIPLSQYLGFMLPLALIPLVILPYEFGLLADRKIGEKELMITGIFIIILVSLIFPFVKSQSVLIWALILLASRIGFSLVQTMTYTYFFKKVHATDIGSITIFSNIFTLANIFVTLLASIIFILGGNILILALCFALATIYSLSKIIKIQDTL